MQVERMPFHLLLLAHYLKRTVFGIWIGDARRIGCSAAVSQQNLIPAGITQHPHAVCALFFREHLRRLNIRSIKQVHTLIRPDNSYTIYYISIHP